MKNCCSIVVSHSMRYFSWQHCLHCDTLGAVCVAQNFRITGEEKLKRNILFYWFALALISSNPWTLHRSNLKTFGRKETQAHLGCCINMKPWQTECCCGGADIDHSTLLPPHHGWQHKACHCWHTHHSHANWPPQVWPSCPTNDCCVGIHPCDVIDCEEKNKNKHIKVGYQIEQLLKCIFIFNPLEVVFLHVQCAEVTLLIDSGNCEIKRKFRGDYERECFTTHWWGYFSA